MPSILRPEPRADAPEAEEAPGIPGPETKADVSEPESKPEEPGTAKEPDAPEAETKPEEAEQKEVPSVRKRRKKRHKREVPEEMVLLADDGEALPEAEEELLPDLPAEAGEALEPVLFAEDAETLEPEPMTEEERAQRRRKIRKVLLITFGSIFGTAAAVYIGFTIFFISHFYFQTTVNGEDFSLKKASDVEAHMADQVEDYTLTLVESSGNREVIDGSEIDVVYQDSDEVEQILKAQNPFLWPMGLWQPSELTAQVNAAYSQEKLTAKLGTLSCMQEENQVPPESAKPEFDGDKFVPGEPVVGSQIEQETFLARIDEYISTYRSELDMAEESCYVKPKYDQNSPEVQAACDEMNKYIQTSVTLNFSPAQEVMDKAVISQWLSVDENMAVTFNQDAVGEYVKTLAEKYDTRGKERSFVAGNGNNVTVSGGDYGWVLDQEAEKNALLESIKKGEVVTVDPTYSQSAATHDGADWGGTYVEVDLSNQYCYLFVGGSVVVSGPCVTGLPSRGDATPPGVYYIKYCQRNAVLRGPRQADGSYQWESPVSFWMPFNGGIGLHDAPWQAAFGGERYLTYGSRGCVNLQYSVAETIFNNVSEGTPVVCHY